MTNPPTPATQPCSDEDIAQIEAALAKATTAPWSEGGTFMPNTEHERVSVWGPTPAGFQSGVWVIKDAVPSDAALIVLLRNNAEALLASAQAHKARAEEAEARVRELMEGVARLGSMEAMVVSRAIVKGQDDELIARVDFARTLLERNARHD